MKVLKKVAASLLALLATGTMLVGTSCSLEKFDKFGILDKLGLGGAQTESSSEVGNSSSEKEEQYPVITIAEALELCGEEGNITTEKYYIRGVVVSVTNPTYGAMVIQDDTGSISVYGTAGYADMAEKPYKGDEVLLYCVLQNFKGKKEVKTAELIELKRNEATADADYVAMSISEARDAETGSKVRVDGVVAQITYANGMKPSGVILVDETQSIYVYDGDLAGRVQKGNLIEIAASKDYWILEDEQSAAQKHGYKGCNQLTDVTLLSNEVR